MMTDGRFSIHKAYYLMKVDYHERVLWRRIITYNKASPRSIFILWMVMKNRLAITDGLLKWNVPCNPICYLCGVIIESTEHLFFECS